MSIKDELSNIINPVPGKAKGTAKPGQSIYVQVGNKTVKCKAGNEIISPKVTVFKTDDNKYVAFSETNRRQGNRRINEFLKTRPVVLIPIGGYSLKILFSIEYTDKIEFYIAGDRTEPLLIHTLQPITNNINDLYVNAAYITSTGLKLNDWIVYLNVSFYDDEYYPFEEGTSNYPGYWGVQNRIYIITPENTYEYIGNWFEETTLIKYRGWGLATSNAFVSDYPFRYSTVTNASYYHTNGLIINSIVHNNIDTFQENDNYPVYYFNPVFQQTRGSYHDLLPETLFTEEIPLFPELLTDTSKTYFEYYFDFISSSFLSKVRDGSLTDSLDYLSIENGIVKLDPINSNAKYLQLGTNHWLENTGYKNVFTISSEKTNGAETFDFSFFNDNNSTQYCDFDLIFRVKISPDVITFNDLLRLNLNEYSGYPLFRSPNIYLDQDLTQDVEIETNSIFCDILALSKISSPIDTLRVTLTGKRDSVIFTNLITPEHTTESEYLHIKFDILKQYRIQSGSLIKDLEYNRTYRNKAFEYCSLFGKNSYVKGIWNDDPYESTYKMENNIVTIPSTNNNPSNIDFYLVQNETAIAITSSEYDFKTAIPDDNLIGNNLYCPISLNFDFEEWKTGANITAESLIEHYQVSANTILKKSISVTITPVNIDESLQTNSYYWSMSYYQD